MGINRIGTMPDLFTNIIFGIVLAISFDKDSVEYAFIPITKLLNLDGFYTASIVFFPIFFVVARYIRYFKEFEIYPTTVKISGIAKTFLNILLIVFIFQMFIVSSPNSNISVGYLIIVIIPIISLITIFIQLMGFLENQRHQFKVEHLENAEIYGEVDIHPKELEYFKNEVFLSWFLFVIFLFCSSIYIFLDGINNNYYLKSEDKNLYDIYFVYFYYFVFAWYYLLAPSGILSKSGLPTMR